MVVLVAPTLVSVYREAGTTSSLSPGWLAAICAAAFAQFGATWVLQRIVLRADRWVDVVAPELIGNAASHVIPGGPAAGAGVQLRLLAQAGFPLAQAATALGAASLLSSAAGYVVLPFVVLVATALGTNIDPALVRAMWAGAVLLAALLVGLVVALSRDRPWRTIASVVARVQRRLHRGGDDTDLEQRLLGERDAVREALRGRRALVALAVVARPAFDFLCLLLALHAVGARINPAAALAAFIVSNVAGLIPLTPGGLGFVEAGLAGTIAFAGAPGAQARAAAATYRLAATWLPCVAGGIAYWGFRRAHPPADRGGGSVG